MKRILFFLVLFVNLQINTEQGLGVSLPTVSAQSFGNEYLDEVVVYGSTVPCPKCGKRIYPEKMLDHANECPDEMETCSKCGAQYLRKARSCHYCCSGDAAGNSHCMFCQRPLRDGETCNCKNIDIAGSKDKGKNSQGGTTVTGSYHPANNATTVTITPPCPPQEFHKPVKGEVLFKQDLPAQTMIQQTRMDCVSTSLGIVFNIRGCEQSAESVRGIIEKKYKDYTDDEMSDVGVKSNAKMHYLMTKCDLFFEPIKVSEIPSAIDEGCPVVGVVPANDGQNNHMVVIVGYFNDFPVDAFQCINPGTGKYETHYASQFVVKDLDDNTKNNSYIYRKKLCNTYEDNDY
jgi:hypothetical protein